MIHEVYDMRNKKKFSLVLSVILTAASVLPCYGATTQEKITDAQNQQAQTQEKPQQTVCVVPSLIGDNQQQRHEPGGGNGRGVTHIKGQIGEKAAIKGLLPG